MGCLYFCALTTFACCGIAAASAADLSAKPNDQDTDKPETVAINAGLTGTSFSFYGDAGVLIAPWADLNTSGFRVRFGSVDGTYGYDTSPSNVHVHGVGEEYSSLLGYSFNSGSTSLLLMLGGDVISTHIDFNDPTNPVHGTEFGLKSLAEFYTNPTKETMFDAQGSYSTAFGEYYSQFEFGYAAFAPEVYLGPLLVVLGDEHFAEWRLGGRLSGVKVGRVELGFDVGYLRERDFGSGTRNGAFAGADMYVRY